MSAGTGTGSSVKATDLGAWALVYDPKERRMYEVIELDADETIVVLLDAGEDYDPKAPQASWPTRRVSVKWAVGNLTLVRPAPVYTPTAAARLPETAGTFRR